MGLPVILTIELPPGLPNYDFKYGYIINTLAYLHTLSPLVSTIKGLDCSPVRIRGRGIYPESIRNAVWTRAAVMLITRENLYFDDNRSSLGHPVLVKTVLVP